MIEAAIAKYLDANVDGLTYSDGGSGGNVHVDEMPTTPDIAVSVRHYGADAQLTTTATDYPTVQVMVRGARHQRRAAYAMARSIYSALHCLDNVTLDDGGEDELWLIGSTALQSGPVPLPPTTGEDRPRYALNLRCRVAAPTAHRS